MARTPSSTPCTEYLPPPAYVAAVALLCFLSFAACSPPPPRPTLRLPTPTLGPAWPTSPSETPIFTPGTEESPASGELRLAVRESVRTLNPYRAINSSEVFLVSLIYDTLLEEDAQSGLTPNLAQRWELSADGRRLVCWLDPRAVWQDGSQVTANDVIFTFGLLRQWAFPGWVSIVSPVQRVEAITRTEVQFTLLSANPHAARRLLTKVPVVPASIWTQVDDPLNYENLDNPVGSGPFALLDHSEQGQFVLQNTKMHHASSPMPATVVVQTARDETQALQALKEGKLDALGWEVSPVLVKNVREHADQYPDVRWMASPGLNMHTLLFNLRREPYDVLELRRALAQALDTRSIVDQVLGGFGTPGSSNLFGPVSPSQDPRATAIHFDPEASKTMLTAAGFVDRTGDGLREGPDGKPWEVIITCPKQEVALQVAGLITTYWKALGVKSKAAVVPTEQMLPTLMTAAFDLALDSIPLSDAAVAYSHFHSSRGLLNNGTVSGFNYGGYASGEYDRIVEQMLEERKRAKYLELVQRLEQILATDLPRIPLYTPHVLNLYRDDRFIGWSPQPGTGLLSRACVMSLRLR